MLGEPLVESLGYTSYSNFKRDLRHAVVSSAGESYSTFWELQQKRLSVNLESGSSRFAGVLFEGEALFRNLNNPHFFAQLEAGIEAILSAKRVFVLGLRTSKPFALNLEYLLKHHMDNVYQLSDESEFMIETIARMKQQDLVIVFAVRPIIKKTGEMVRLCHKLGIPVMLITTGNQDQHPLTSLSRVVISAGEIDSLLSCVPLILINELLAHESGRRLEGQAKQDFQRLERILEENNLTIWEQ